MVKKPTCEELGQKIGKSQGRAITAYIDDARRWRLRSALAGCLVVLLVVAWGGLCFAQDPSSNRTVLAKGSDTYMPYSFLNEDGKIDGFNNELFKAVAETAGLKAKIELNPWPIIRKELESGKIDVITGMYYSKERDKVVDFSVPHNIVKYSIFVREDSQIKSLADLNGKEIVVMRGAISHDFLKQKGIAGNIITTNDTLTALRLLAAGKHDCLLLVRLQGLYFMKKFKIGNVKAVGEPFKTMKFCFAVREGDSELLARLNEGLFIIKEMGKYDEIYNKWFGILERQAVSIRQILRYTIFILIPVAIVGLLLASVFWSWSLKRQVKIKTDGLNVELSERKRAAEALRESEEKYRTILESIEDGYFEVDIRGNFTFFNDSMCKILGYPRDELIGMNNREYMDQENAKNLYQTFNRVYTTGEPTKGFDYEIIRKEGAKGYVESSASVIKDAEGQPIGFRGIMRDVTARKQMEMELTQTKNFLQNILDSSIDGITTTDLHGNVIYTSPRTRDIFGYRKEKIIGKKVHSFYSNGKEDAKAIMKELMAKGELRDHEMKMIRKDGELIDINLSASLLKDEKGEVIGTVGIYRDITAKNILEAQLAQAQRMEAIGTLAGGMAHNFNNLLMAIQGNASIMLLDFDSTHPHHERLKSIENGVQRGSRLTRQLLGYARGGKYEPRAISLNQLVKETSNTFGETRKEVVLHRELAEGLYGIKADQSQIEQSLLNLYVNAAEAMADGGDLFLKTMNVTHKDMRGKSYNGSSIRKRTLLSI